MMNSVKRNTLVIGWHPITIKEVFVIELAQMLGHRREMQSRQINL